jgi:hypothetical protein
VHPRQIRICLAVFYVVRFVVAAISSIGACILPFLTMPLSPSPPAARGTTLGVRNGGIVGHRGAIIGQCPSSRLFADIST